MGLEPTTSGTTIQRSNLLSYNHRVLRCKYSIKFLSYTIGNVRFL